MPDFRKLCDAELTGLLKSDDRDAFSEIYQRYYGMLYAHALKMLHDGDEVSDLLQELFVTLWAKRAALSFAPNLSAYLYRAVRNRVIDTFHRSRVRQAFLDSLQDYINAGSRVTEETVRLNELAAQIESEVGRLPEKMRHIFELSRKEQLSHKEIAEQLNISDKTVKKQINKAIHELRLKINTLLFSTLL